ncbi:hypothetical protein Xmau_04479 [Xenorhabdus mauleonii]|uniref:Uncharacterized protein n=1 Tax=Xenorhabdus mauleonii TaxID=351675 RepID=A0A1I3YBY7_9GAMM|nr:hypothetical protein Xmau_04479 [Xenorhabdus mauleonii]SFK29315.1 hypothetical protein SAMN05421680_14910 [Xenorhabdus mauleonii]
MADERGTTINILALVVTFFGLGCMFKAAAGMGDVAAKGASHHDMRTCSERAASSVRQWREYSRSRAHVSIGNLDFQF